MKKFALASTFMALIGVSYSQDFALVSSNSEHIQIRHGLRETAPLYTTIESENYRDFSKSHQVVSMEQGSPALPYFTESVIVPDQGKVNLVITHGGYTEYTGVKVAPSKGDLKRNVLPEEIPFTFGPTYTTDSFYPGQLASLTTPFNLRNTRGVTVKVQPYQYNPVTEVLRVYENIQVSVNTDAAETGINELAPRPENTAAYQQAYEAFYLNASNHTDRYAVVEEEGEMLIITPGAYSDEIAPLAEWKNQEGIKTTVVTTSETGTTDTEIKAYIESFYAENPNLVFLLLVGDHSQIPAHTYGSSGWEELWSDSYYGQLTGGSSDFYPELFVGRFSGNQTQVSTMVERTLEYEKTPADGAWMTRAIGLASDEGYGYGDDSEADWQHARNNREKLLDYGYTEVHEFYDGSQGGADAPGNPSATIISPAVNEGIGLFNYTGHGDELTCITGNYTSGDIHDATNNGKYPFVISVACNNGTFTSGTCISETWLRATNAGSPTGAIAACGSTILMAWAEPMQTQDEMADIISHSYADNRKATLGGIFYNAQMSMLETYGSSSTAREVMQTWVMFGDPSALFRNQVTKNMVVTHPANKPLGTTAVEVTCDTEDALIAISQEGELLGTAKVSGGTATITFDALATSAPLTVTATKQNYAPYEGTITIGESLSTGTNHRPDVKVYPNPATAFFTVQWSGEVRAMELTDMTGKTVWKSVEKPADNQLTLSTENLESGLYLLRVSANNTTSTTKIQIR